MRCQQTDDNEDVVMCGSSGEDLTAYTQDQLEDLIILSPFSSEVQDECSL